MYGCKSRFYKVAGRGEVLGDRGENPPLMRTEEGVRRGK